MNQMHLFKASLVLLFALAALLVSCQDDSSDKDPLVDITQARFLDFALEEVAYTDIAVTHPEIKNGAEEAWGTITIVVPPNSSQLVLTPKLTNFNNAGFTLAPALGVAQDFSDGAITYTISSLAAPDKKVHYRVNITEESVAEPAESAISAFRFEKSRNPRLAADIEAARIVDPVASMGKIYIFVPEGTDFSGLNPTIQHNGTGLYYTQDAESVPANSTSAYPAGGLPIDFTYPKVFYAVLKNANITKTYEVVVDVKNPIRLDSENVTTAAVAKGAVRTVEATYLTNQGNHPISLSSIGYTNQAPAGLNVIRASVAVPAFGIAPGERVLVNASISAQTYPAGTYQTTAVLKPHFFRELDTATLLEAAELSISSAITD
ncbi:hypothetical protein [Cesiribacter sp. SM1]|uniref:hypothetical protein n=1 Tax=Cesiribacter sp. SM1 TaxID=2861196 RepID=UPI001CD26FEB|nr:hypothetical protein [Cesiribacter sp. SM1]